jgi:hypothetical protein
VRFLAYFRKHTCGNTRAFSENKGRAIFVFRVESENAPLIFSHTYPCGPTEYLSWPSRQANPRAR